MPLTTPPNVCAFLQTMLRTSLTRALSLGVPTRALAAGAATTTTTTTTHSHQVRFTANVAKAPEKIEVFVDGISVMVEPGTTVLQVSRSIRYAQYINLNTTCFGCISCRLPPRLVSKFRVSATTNVSPLPATVACASSKWRSHRNRWPPVRCPS